MSGTNAPPNQAPTVILTMLGNQPIGIDTEGKPVLPTMPFVQMVQRIVSYLGQPVPSSDVGGRSGVTLSQQMAVANGSIQGLTAERPTGGDLRQDIQDLQQVVVRQDILPPLPDPSSIVIEASPPVVPFPLTGILELLNGVRVMDGYGSPESAVFGSPGDLFLRRDGAAGEAAYVKDTGDGTDIGWLPFGGGVDSIYAPLVNGDLPGPTAVASPDGEFIMVPIT